MHRRLFIAGALATAAGFAASRVGLAAQDSGVMKGNFPPIEKSHDQWRQLLEKQQYQVLFEEATERPWSSPLNDEKREGTYICSACYLPLFESAAKFDSGTGWPSFYQAIDGNVGTKRDWKLILPRTEYHCARCEGHQGHVFDDGPQPTGKRWCNNGVALRFVPKTEELPALRV
ncbi:MAG TPA: peptide-methionine (R)-S-oxide reductase MsrB [Gammaproteobacteria bacterium]|nr:peptide-methionine (R)-S-oxide reductase MsrB [Gammaproteobacteria bacterium]